MLIIHARLNNVAATDGDKAVEAATTYGGNNTQITSTGVLNYDGQYAKTSRIQIGRKFVVTTQRIRPQMFPLEDKSTKLTAKAEFYIASQKLKGAKGFTSFNFEKKTLMIWGQTLAVTDQIPIGFPK